MREFVLLLENFNELLFFSGVVFFGSQIVQILEKQSSTVG